MRNLIIILSVMLIVLSCKKDCETNINDLNSFHKDYFDVYYCSGNQEWEYFYYDYDSFIEQEDCFSNIPIVVPLDFNGIIISKGIKIDYYKNRHEVEIIINECDKKIYYNYITTIEDTLTLNNNLETVVTVIDSIPNDYTVEITHEIIPYKE